MDLSRYDQLEQEDRDRVIKAITGGQMPPTGETPLTADEQRVLFADFVSVTTKGD